MSKKIGAIGRESFILGFRLAGVRRAVRAEDEDAYAEALEAALEDEELGILVVHADDVEELVPRRLRSRMTASVDPVVIQVGQEGVGDMRERVKQAIGIDLFADDASPPAP